MKKTIVLGLAVAVMTVISFTALADSKYPAADFEPQVIYLDKSVVATQSPTPTSSPCPANTTTQVTAQPVADEFDPKYPAANFQPKVIYP